MFVIEATGDSEANAKIAALTQEQQLAEQRPMIQVLLEERFKLRTHWETKQGDVYNLVVSKGGPRLAAEGTLPPSADEWKNFGDRPVPLLYQKNDGRGYDFVAHGCSMGQWVPVTLLVKHRDESWCCRHECLRHEKQMAFGLATCPLHAGFGFLSGAVLAQTKMPVKSPLSFEVASIKRVGPLNLAALQSGRQPGMSVDKARVHFANTSLMELIWHAYIISSNRIVGGPAWLWAGEAERFDVAAKIPDGAATDQVPEMLRTLLAERFKLVSHFEKREVPAYALTLGRGGAALKEAVPELNAPEGEETHVIQGKNGRVRYEFDSVTMTRFASLLSRYTDLPVVDQTGLQDRYQASYEIDFMALAYSGLMRISLHPESARIDGIAGPRDSIDASLKQVGLQLDSHSRRLPADVLVIDHIERTPTEN